MMLSPTEKAAGVQTRYVIQMRAWGLRANSPIVGRGALVQVTVQAAEWDNAITGKRGRVFWWEGRFVSYVDNRSELMAQLTEIMGQGPIALYQDLAAAGLRDQFARICCGGNQHQAIHLMPLFRPEKPASQAGQRQGIQNRETEVALSIQDLLTDALTPWTHEQTDYGATPQNKAQLVGKPLVAATTRTTVSNPTAQGLQRINRSKGEEPAVDALIAASYQITADLRSGKYKRPHVIPEKDSHKKEQGEKLP